MKKIIFILSFVLYLFIFINDAKAVVCPPGYSGPFHSVLYLSGTCRIEFDWCCDNLVSPSGTMPAVHFSNISFTGACNLNEIDYVSDGDTTYPVVPWEKLMLAVIEDTNFCGTLDIIPCDEANSQFYMKVSNGGCYSYQEYFDQNMEYHREYVVCGSEPQVAYCYEKYKICYIWDPINLHWDKQIEGEGQQIPFTCESGCMPICR